MVGVVAVAPKSLLSFFLLPMEEYMYFSLGILVDQRKVIVYKENTVILVSISI